MHSPVNAQRRQLLKGSIVSPALVAAGGVLARVARAAGRVQLNWQLGWIPGINQAGEVVAKRLGYYEQEGLQLSIHPGGPSVDGIAAVASGRCQIGQVSSSHSVMLAVSQGLPIRSFAIGAQRHPYCYVSLRRNPVRKPQDLAGKRVGVQPTGVGLLRALLARNRMPEQDVQVVPVGAEIAPLLTGQVDVVTAWLTNTTALGVIGADRVEMPLWDTGVKLYALAYYANLNVLRREPALLEAFLRASARGWLYAREHRDEAVDMLVAEYPNLVRANERIAIDTMLPYSFADVAGVQGWGAMDPAVWQEQIDLHAQLRLFTAATPKLADVITLDILKATQATRLHG
jgi:NitT/TauT family transport system substrate-binding protein